MPIRFMGFLVGNLVAGGLRAIGQAVVFGLVMIGGPMLISRYGWPF